MTLAKLFVLILAPALWGMAGPERETFDLKVTLVRPLRNQSGGLHIDAQGVAFRSGDGKTSITIGMKDLREADIADFHALRFETYDVRKWRPIGRREYTFKAQPDAPVEEIARFLAGRSHRPVVGHYAEGSQFQVAAYHRRALGGTNGMLEIGKDSIQFFSEKPADSRTWLYRDIETIGRPDSYRFRVSTIAETYVLELKDDLPEAAYQLAWSRIYDAGRSSK